MSILDFLYKDGQRYRKLRDEVKVVVIIQPDVADVDLDDTILLSSAMPADMDRTIDKWEPRK